MPKDKKAEIVVSKMVGPVELTGEFLASCPVDGYARNGVVLVNERENFTIVQDGRPIKYTASLYIQRDAITQDEQNEVASTKEQREGDKAKRDKETEDKRQREIARSFELGQSSTMSALENIGRLASGARALTALQNHRD